MTELIAILSGLELLVLRDGVARAMAFGVLACSLGWMVASRLRRRTN